MSIPPKPPISGAQAALQYTGIPASWLSKRPKLPSRNWLIFLTTTTTVLSYYIYDRKQSKAIRQEYIDRVKHLADQPLGTMDLPRKVLVYGARYPGDQEYDRSIRHFKKYVKPILVAAAVDYELVVGKRHGDIATQVSDSIKKSRRIAAGLEQPPTALMALPHYPPYEVQKQREIEGGVVIVGRPTFKEYMAGLKMGWSNGMSKVDREEELVHKLADDGHFDEPEEDIPRMDFGDGEPIPTRSVLPSTNNRPLQAMFSPNRIPKPPPPTKSEYQPSHSDNAPDTIPSLPPILLVPFRNLVGIKVVPIIIWEFFNQRHKVREGAEAGVLIVNNHTRPFNAPTSSVSEFSQDTPPEDETSEPVLSTMKGGDFDFDQSIESYYKSNLSTTIEDIEKERKKYYTTTLPPKLANARALARNSREPTKEELAKPPPTEVELRAERIKKELKWRGDEAGWRIVGPDAGVQWDERLREVLRVYNSTKEDDSEFASS